MKHYHYIFAGAGLASLMTVYRMAVSGKFTDKQILLIDPSEKKANDRTWCFWQKGKSDWDEIIFRKWEKALFANEKFHTHLNFGGYVYNMIRGIDFYNFVFTELKKHPNIEFTQKQVVDFVDLVSHVTVKTGTESYTCNTLLNSIYNPALVAGQTDYPVLQQHFIGWHIKAEQPAFDPQTPIFMDFSIPQKGNTRFIYVLPFNNYEAIVEYTLFSKDLLSREEYETAIKDYLMAKGITRYTLVDKEHGSIPMTSYPFWKRNTNNIIHIGSAGGWTKASTGYTFRNSDKRSKQLIHFLEKGTNGREFIYKKRFWLYDLLLLDILADKNYRGSAIFSSMFKNGKAATVFKFLDEETNLAEDLEVIWRCPKGLFIKALLKRIFLNSKF